MAVVGFSCVRGKIPLAEHQRCMLNEAPCGFSPTILEMMIRPTVEREREGVQFSPSSIAGCHRQHALQSDHDWYIDPDKVYASVRGTLFHHGLAEEPAPAGTLGAIRELRMHAPIETSQGTQKFSGQVDEILLLSIDTVEEKMGNGSMWYGETTLHVSITDWKTKSDIPHSLLEADRRHVYQINDYAWLTTQVLADYLNNWEILAPKEARFELTGDFLPRIDRVVVDGLTVSYLSMSKSRKFESGKLLYGKGKQKMAEGTDGKMHRVEPIENEVLELAPLHEFDLAYTESLIRKGIEDQIAGRESLAAPLEGDDAYLMCPSCGVKDVCITLGKAQGYDMAYQEGKKRWVMNISITSKEVDTSTYSVDRKEKDSGE
jgi:hypothetical protein